MRRRAVGTGGTRTIARAAVLALLALAAASPAAARTRVGAATAIRIESPHPHPRGDATRPVVWQHVLHHPGATFLKLRFARFELGPGAVVRVLDGQGRVAGEYTAARNGAGAFWAFSVPGDTVTVELRADAARPGAGVVIDRYGSGTSLPSIQSVCGGSNLEDVACYAGTAIEAASRAVGRLLFEEDGFLVSCTGFLVSSRDHFLTSAHCFTSPRSIESLEVAFDDQRAACGGDVLLEPERFAGDRLLVTSRRLDVALLTLAGQPSARHGYLPLSARLPALDEALYVPQHPRGGIKKVAVQDCRVSSPVVDGGAPGSDLGHQCDTEPGSSGSPLLDASHEVVGVHRLGGCTALGGENQAVLMSRVLTVIPPQQTELVLDEGRMELAAGGGHVTLRGVLRPGLDREEPALLRDPVTLVLADADGPFYTATVAPERFRRQGATILFIDPAGTIAGGVKVLQFRRRADGTLGVTVQARRVPLAGADRREITVTIHVGAETASTTGEWRRRPRAWVHP
jgi:hypothetical protein